MKPKIVVERERWVAEERKLLADIDKVLEALEILPWASCRHVAIPLLRKSIGSLTLLIAEQEASANRRRI